ncbi:MAG: universal stress protein [Betaproteobacteria bacterium]|nr:universal stress protein [Betaproteobacteria bacterium]
MFKQILLANDGSEASLHAARLALNLARVHGASLTMVSVVDPYPFIGIGEVNPMGFDAYMAAARVQAQQAHQKVLDLAQSLNSPLALKVLMVEDVSVVEGIVKTAEDMGADVIVLGSHGRNAISRMIMGSVAHKVLSHSPVPVLISR